LGAITIWQEGLASPLRVKYFTFAGEIFLMMVFRRIPDASRSMVTIGRSHSRCALAIAASAYAHL